MQQSKATRIDLDVPAGAGSAGDAGADDAPAAAEPAALRSRVAALEVEVADRDNQLYVLQDAIAHQSIQLMDALESLAEGFVLLNADLTVIVINARVGALFAAHGRFWEPGSRLADNLLRLDAAGLIFHRHGSTASVQTILDEVAAGEDIDLLVTNEQDSWTRFDLRPTTDPGYVLTFQDIGNLKCRERDLRAQGGLLQATLDSIGQGIAAFDIDGRLIAGNLLFGNLLHLPPALLATGTPRTAILSDLRGRNLLGDTAAGKDINGPDADWRAGRLLKAWPMRVGNHFLEIAQSPMADGGSVTTVTDVTERREAQKLLIQRATLDALTGLPNRAVGLDRLRSACSHAKRTGSRAAVLFVDLDGFKFVNDTFGHTTGDTLIIEAGRRMGDSLRASDTVARLGGDEFLIIIGALNHTDDIATVAEKLLHKLGSAFVIDGNVIHVSASIGAAIYPDDTEDSFLLLNHADRAMYAAKESGKNTYRYFAPHMNIGRANRLRVEADFRLAMEQERLLVYYQPIVDCRTGVAIGAEALTRWPRDDGSFVPPDQFMPIIEETPLIVPFGEWVLRRACRDARRWMAALGRPVTISVNISPRQFRDKNLVPTVIAVLAETGLEPAHLKLEVTENIMAQDVSGILEIMLKLNDIGVMLSMDDFGTGYSSLRYIKDFPFKTLKIDKAFVRGVPDNPTDVALARTIIAMARSLDIRVIAEGVETAEQHAFLVKHQCELGQGYLFGKPQQGDSFLDIARQSLHAAAASPRADLPPVIDAAGGLEAIATLSDLSAELSHSNSAAAAALDKVLARLRPHFQAG